MDSRLDRLFVLLDTGSNDSIRLAAAKQIGEVQRIQPRELNYLLSRIKEYSSKSVWETRVAAGQATSFVLEHVPPWPSDNLEFEPDNESKSICKQTIAINLIEQTIKTDSILERFDLDKIMSICPALLSIDVTEQNDDSDLASVSRASSSRSRKGSVARKNDKEQLMRQRKLINKELGISMVDSLNLGIKSTDIVSNDDLQEEFNSTLNTTNMAPNLREAHLVLNGSTSNYDMIISKLVECDCITNVTSYSSESGSTEDPRVWPLSRITREYVDDLFSPSWEKRHGAAIALREFVKLQGNYAGKRADVSSSINEKLNQVWLIDMSLRSLCILGLDKFGDFLFDQVVAPVRENAAQLLGCCVALMNESNAHLTVKILLKMMENTSWEVRHGGILGLKYSLTVVRDDFAKRLLVECFDSIFKLLGDSFDDVSAEAAATLVPVKGLMIETIPDKTPKLIKFLWEHLGNLDELTTSTSNIVLLLASLITSSSSDLDSAELVKSLPRLWPLLGHPSTTVRSSALKALITLVKTQRHNCLSWIPEDLYVTITRLLFQRAILENMEEVRLYIHEMWTLLLKTDDKDQVRAQNEKIVMLKTVSQYLNYWLCLIMHPINTPIDRGSSMWLNLRLDGSISSEKPDGEVYLGSITFNADSIDQQKSQVTRCRLLGAQLAGSLYSKLVDNLESQHSRDTLGYLGEMFIYYIKTKSANQRIYSGWLLDSWAEHQAQVLNNDCDKLKSILPKGLLDQLNAAIQETNLCYDELAANFTRLQQEAREFVATLKESNVILSNVSTDRRAIYNLNQIQSLCDLNLEVELTKLFSKKQPDGQNKMKSESPTTTPIYSVLMSKKTNLSKSLKSTNLTQKSLSVSVLSSLSCAHISWRLIPEKLELLANPLLSSIESTEDLALLRKSVKHLIILLDYLCGNEDKQNAFANTIVTKLINMLNKKDANSDKRPLDTGQPENISKQCEVGDTQRIVLLDNLQRIAAQSRLQLRRQSSTSSTGPSLKRSLSLSSSNELEIENYEEINRANELATRGATETLSGITKHFGYHLPEKMPLLWRSITDDIKSRVNSISTKQISSEEEISELTKNLLVLETVGQSIDIRLQSELVGIFRDLINVLDNRNSLLRHRVSQCLGVISRLLFDETITMTKDEILPMLEREDNILARCGSIEALASMIEHLQMELVPRINLFIVHVLRRMSDQNDQVRLMATHCFGKLLSLMPLNLERNKNLVQDNGRCTTNIQAESEIVKVETPKSEVKSNIQDEQKFIEQLLNPKKLDNFKIPFEMNAGLRSYQQDGLNWLAFLNRFNLHGILCDEMGLGKTFMTICMVTSDHYISNLELNEKSRYHPSLIICPPTLTEHWLYEIIKFLPDEIRSKLNPVAYTKDLPDRNQLKDMILKNTGKEMKDLDHNSPVQLIVTSYDIVRNDIEFFKDVNWNYCVLDEGHIIKNVKTKLSKAIRLLNAKHRLILSGTPIQNNVSELWSLFDFLMPGFLGSERQFNNRYSRPILQSREPKCNSRDLEAGALAMESLHRQVLPFILRRLKEEVLDDLPPKIIQDYYCELSPLQMKLYEDFTRSKLCQDVTKKSFDEVISAGEHQNQPVEAVNARSHVFQALQYLKNVCNHPKLVLTPKHSQYSTIKKSLDIDKTSLDDITHSSKLSALKQLLIDCGIGEAGQGPDESGYQQGQSLALESVINQHRALIFCQVRSMVNIIENDLLKKHLPSITYLKLDGSVPANQRQSIVNRFNDDPSIDILLLTTQIGGLGLNLTGADTVIFVEHDWNPTKDLQAMDRAHRIGQKKVVNVYRLITKATLEEKIMGLQKFKTMVSNTVINQDNAALNTMNVDQLFDLFDNNSTSGSGRAANSTTRDQVNPPTRSKSSFIDLLPELWGQQQYETEYDLSNFISSLKSGG